MNVRVKFLGAAGTVTGSKYLLELDNKNHVMVDCGMFQGLKVNRKRNWDDLPIDVETVDAVVLTHAHLDHTGYLPRLVRQGFSGPVYCTKATAELAAIILRDAAKLQEEEAAYARKKGYSKHEKPEPLFDSKDAEQAIELFVPLPFHHEFEIVPGMVATYFVAGHILGAASVQITVTGEHQSKKITFSGDLGRYDDPILHDPEKLPDTDILFMESTYGDRLNPATDVEGQMRDIINETLKEGGCLMIPAFAVGRTQLMIYYLHELIKKGEIPSSVKIFIDSPMAISVTQLYRDFESLHKLRDNDLTDNAHPTFDFRNIQYCRSHEDSYKLNFIESNAIIVSASGMITGGRILHHLYNRLPNQNDTLMLVGYQAEGTRGRRILNGEETIRIFGIEVPVKCRVSKIAGLSAHGDQAELIQWLQCFTDKPKMTFIVHGEEEAARVFADKLQTDMGWNTFVPNYLESFSLFEGI